MILLADQRARESRVKDQTQIDLWIPTQNLMQLKKTAGFFEAGNADVSLKFNQQLIEIKRVPSASGIDTKAIFRDNVTGKVSTAAFDLLHVVPPMSAPSFIRNSAIATADGWIDVDRHTFQSHRFSNVFAIGDCLNQSQRKESITSKEVPIAVQNIVQVIGGGFPTAAFHTLLLEPCSSKHCN